MTHRTNVVTVTIPCSQCNFFFEEDLYVTEYSEAGYTTLTVEEFESYNSHECAGAE